VSAPLRASALSFDDVVRASRSLVRAVAMRVLHDEADADDAVQDTFLRALSALDTLRDPRALPAWIARIAHRAAVDRLRAKTMRGWRDDDNADVDVADRDAPSPEDCALASCERHRLERALSSLPREMRRVIELRALGMTGPEIASALGVALGTVESRLHRARQRIVSDCFDGERRRRRARASG
jgi:RNA polymerase sigma-70 factor (ECF subfamily)